MVGIGGGEWWGFSKVLRSALNPLKRKRSQFRGWMPGCLKSSEVLHRGLLLRVQKRVLTRMVTCKSTKSLHTLVRRVYTFFTLQEYEEFTQECVGFLLRVQRRVLREREKKKSLLGSILGTESARACVWARVSLALFSRSPTNPPIPEHGGGCTRNDERVRCF